MPQWNEIIRLCKLILKFFDLLIIHLDEAATLHTDKMVMVLLPDFLLISCFLLADLYFLGKAALTQQTQIPVDGRVTDLGILLMYYGK